MPPVIPRTIFRACRTDIPGQSTRKERRASRFRASRPAAVNTGRGHVAVAMPADVQARELEHDLLARGPPLQGGGDRGQRLLARLARVEQESLAEHDVPAGPV